MWYTHENNVVTLDLYVQPGAKCTEITGLHGGSLKIRLASPPIDGHANMALLKYISLLFDVPLRQVELLRGDKSRHKKVIVTGSKFSPESLFDAWFKKEVTASIEDQSPTLSHEQGMAEMESRLTARIAKAKKR